MGDVIIAALLMLSCAQYSCSLSVPEAVYQPEIELNFQHYRTHPEKMELLVNCVLRDGRCDRVGEWVKARIFHRFKTGQCEPCTRQQTDEATKFVNYFLKERQDLRQEAINKHLQFETVQSANSLQSAFQTPAEELCLGYTNTNTTLQLEEILRFPKAGPRNTNRQGRNRRKSTMLTDINERNVIQDEKSADEVKKERTAKAASKLMRSNSEKGKSQETR